MEIVLVISIIVGILAAAYPISHTFEHLEGNTPPPDVQENNEKKEGYSLLILLACVGGGIFLIFTMMN